MLAVKPIAMDDEIAEEIAIEILIWLSKKLDIMERFIAMSGISGDEIRNQIGKRSFYAGLTVFILNHEPDLIDFSNDRGVPINQVRQVYEHFADESVPWL